MLLTPLPLKVALWLRLPGGHELVKIPSLEDSLCLLSYQDHQVLIMLMVGMFVTMAIWVIWSVLPVTCFIINCWTSTHLISRVIKVSSQQILCFFSGENWSRIIWSAIFCFSNTFDAQWPTPDWMTVYNCILSGLSCKLKVPCIFVKSIIMCSGIVWQGVVWIGKWL